MELSGNQMYICCIHTYNVACRSTYYSNCHCNLSCNGYISPQLLFSLMLTNTPLFDLHYCLYYKTNCNCVMHKALWSKHRMQLVCSCSSVCDIAQSCYILPRVTAMESNQPGLYPLIHSKSWESLGMRLAANVYTVYIHAHNYICMCYIIRPHITAILLGHPLAATMTITSGYCDTESVHRHTLPAAPCFSKVAV